MTTTAAKSHGSTSASAKKRGGYSFSDAGSSAPASNTAKKGKKSGAKKSATSSRNNLELGFASIARKTSNTARQAANTATDASERGAKVLGGAFANAATNVKQAQTKINSLGRNISDNLSQSANKAAKNASKSLEIQRENAEALTQSYATASEAFKQASQEMFSFFNNSFAQNVEAARLALECKNVGEFFEVHNELAKQNLEAAFEQAIKISELAIETASQALEPINASVTRSSKKLSELVSA